MQSGWLVGIEGKRKGKILIRNGERTGATLSNQFSLKTYRFNRKTLKILHYVTFTKKKYFSENERRFWKHVKTLMSHPVSFLGRKWTCFPAGLATMPLYSYSWVPPLDYCTTTYYDYTHIQPYPLHTKKRRSGEKMITSQQDLPI